MAVSAALKDFRSNLGMARQLWRIETQTFPDPPPPEKLQAVRGIRSGVAVLSVAAFEGFLKDLFSEQIDALAPSVSASNFNLLPDKLQVANTFSSLEHAMRGPRFGAGTKKINRLPDVRRMAGYVYSYKLNSEIFGNASGNPGRETIKKMCGEVGLKDVFNKIRARFETRWRQPIGESFIPDKLEEIVVRRHKAAHGLPGLSISRKDLRDSLKFMRILAEVLDIAVREHFRTIARKIR